MKQYNTIQKSELTLFFSVVSILGLYKQYPNQYMLIGQDKSGLIFLHYELNHKLRIKYLLDIFSDIKINNLILNTPNIVFIFHFIKSSPFTSTIFIKQIIKWGIKSKLILRDEFPSEVQDVKQLLKNGILRANNFLIDRINKGKLNEDHKFVEVLKTKHFFIERVNAQFYNNLIKIINGEIKKEFI